MPEFPARQIRSNSSGRDRREPGTAPAKSSNHAGGILGGISDDGRRARLLAASYRTPETEIVLSLKNAGRYAMEAKILDHEHNFEPAKITVLNDRVILHKNRPGSAVFILDIRQL